MTNYYTKLDRLAEDLERVKVQLHAAVNTPQMQRASVDAGSIDFNDEDGNVKAIMGLQHDGTTTVNVVNGPTPPTPSGLSVEVDNGRITAKWDGTFEDGAVAPADWARVQAYVKEGQFVTADPQYARGSIVSAAGGEVVVGVLRGSYTVCLAAWSQAGKVSAMSIPITVEVPGFGDIVLEEIDAAATLIKNAGEMLIGGQETLAEKLAGMGEGMDPEQIATDIATARQEAIDAALAEIEAVEGTLSSLIGGKNSTTWSTSDPPAVYDGAIEDTWVKLTSLGSGGREVGRFRWNGSVWVTHKVDGAVLSNVDASTITTGFLDVVNRIRSGSILADKLLIGGARNLIPNGDLSQGDASLWPSPTNGTGPTYSETEKPEGLKGSVSYHSTGTISPTDFGRWSVNGMTDLVFEVWAKADKPDSRIYVEVRDQDGTLIGTESRSAFGAEGGWKGAPAAASYAYPVASCVVPTTWTKLRSTVKVPPETTEVYVARVYFNHSSGTERDAIISLSGMRLAPMVDGTLITPGGIQTPHLAADVLEVANLKAGTGEMAEAVIKKLFAEVVVAQMVQAQEFIGENAILTGAITAPKIVASEELTAKIAEFLRVRAEMIEADAIDGMVVHGLTLIAGDDRHRLDDAGYALFDDNGDRRTFLSPEGSTFKGEVEAESLVANGGAELKGTNNTLAQGAKLTLAAGVTDPTAPPVVQPYWEGVEFTPPAGVTTVGLAFDGTHYWTAEAWPRVGTAWKINATTGAAEQVSIPSAWGRVFGVTCIGSELYWLTLQHYTSKVIVTDLNLAEKREFEFEDIGFSSTNPLVYKPGIGTDGTNVVIAHCSDDGTLRVRTYNKTTGSQIGGTISEGNDKFKSDITGVYIGKADDSVTRVYVNQARTGIVYTYTTSGVYDSSRPFNVASEGSTGLIFEEGEFQTLDPSGVVHKYAGLNTGDNSSDWWAAYAWAEDWDANGVTETWSRISPPKRFTWPRRAGIKFIGQPLPAGVQMILPAIAKKTTFPTRTDFHSPSWSFKEGRPVAWYNELPTDWASFPSPRDSNNFPEAEKAVVESASATFRVEGDGSGRWGPLTFNPDGSLSGINKTAAGRVVMSPTAENERINTFVTFPAGRFSEPPAVAVTADSVVPERIRGISASSPSSTGFRMYFSRTTVADTGVTWIAMEMD